jgi:hypothetical protein
MVGSSGLDEETVAQAAVAVTGRLVDKLPVITGTIKQSVVAAISELRDEEQLQQLLRDTVESNVEMFSPRSGTGSRSRTSSLRQRLWSTPGGWPSGRCRRMP